MLKSADHRADRARDPTLALRPAAAARARAPTLRRRRRWRRARARVQLRDRGCAPARSRRVPCPAAARAVDHQVTRTRRRGRRPSRRRLHAAPDRDRPAPPDGRDPAIGSPIPPECIRQRRRLVPARSDTSEEATVNLFLLLL